MKQTYYLAYGSNLNLRQMKGRCKNAKKVGTSILKGYRLLFKGVSDCSYLTIEKDEKREVPLGIWLVDENDMRSLDIYEGYPSVYYRKSFNVELTKEDGKKENIEGIAYIMHEDRNLGLPRDTYLETCKEGYSDFGFDEKYLLEAYQESLTRMKK